ncbi:zinc finger, CCHC-type containing protein [Tanacetum coccineum]
MTTLKFADTQNMAAFLSIPVESEGFEQIVDFLNSYPIKHALTVNPTIYTSPKKKDTQVPQYSFPSDNVANEDVLKELDDSLVRAATTASSLEAEQDSGNIIKTRSKATPNEAGSQGTTSGGRKAHLLVQANPSVGHLKDIWRKYTGLGLYFGRNRTRVQLYTKEGLKNYSQKVETALGILVTPSRFESGRVRRNCDCVWKTTRLRLFQFSLRDQASNWLEHLPTGSISTWEDLANRFLAQFFPPGRTSKLCNDILMFQQHQGESLSEAWTRFKDLLQKVPHQGIDLWLKIQIFYDHVNPIIRRTIDQAASGKLRDKNDEESWTLLEDLALYENESWNVPRDFAKPVKVISLPKDI